MIRRLVRVFSVLTILAAIAFGTLYWYLGSFAASQSETFVEITHGMSSSAIADTLTRQDLVRSRWAFLAARAINPKAVLQAGDYRFGPEQTPLEIFDKIRRGDVYYESITIPEGSNMFDIATILDQTDTISGADFLKSAANPALIHELDPTAPSLEGYLFPSTYRVTRATTAAQFCQMMTAEFLKRWHELAADTPSADTHRIITLASLVEKETALPAERPLVAGVFARRLEIRMPLQCDPTTVYAALLEKRYRGVIHKSDLASDNPYNTYAHSGLPPGPIANPGVRSIQAAIHPSGENFLFFVARADGTGSHRFSATLAEHEKAVAEFRKASH